MIIQAFPSGPFETNAYVVVCPQTRVAAIIDPAPGCASAIKDYLTQHSYKPEKILLTHSHWDHFADMPELKEHYGIPIYVHSEDSANIENPGSDGLPLWITIKGVKPDYFFSEGDLISVGNRQFKVIDTPGHTPGGVCFYCPEEKLLFSGDTLFKGTIGNLSFSTARPKLMWQSLAKLAKLPLDTQVLPGHGQQTTIGAESWLPEAERFFS
jgi:glyoxylase-like metal-dependent hydrolase (beta-lactamase superfamily II)